jgi:hypothetical protein
MASTYSQYKIELVGTGEQAGTWGTTTNNNFGSATPGTYQGFEQAIGGRADVTMSGTTTLSLTNSNAAQDARALYLNLSGTLSGAADLVVPALQKSYLVKNGTTGGFAVTIKVTGQTGVSIPNGKTVWVYNNGTDIVTAVDFIPEIATTTVDATNIEVTNIKAKDGTSAGSIADSTGVVTLASSVLTTTDINGGTIDGAVIGGASADAGSFTTLNTSGQVVFNDAGADVDFRVEGDTEANLLFVDASADWVGIGVTPSTRLHVFGADTSQRGQISAQGSSGNAGRMTVWNDSAYVGELSTSGSNLSLYTSGISIFSAGSAERMRIDSSGNVMIGNTVGASFDAISKTLSVGSGSGNQGITVYSGTASAGSVVFADGTSGTDAYQGIIQYEHTNNELLFYVNYAGSSAPRMRIDSSGNVGIGTTPSKKLQVAGDILMTGSDGIGLIPGINAGSLFIDRGGSFTSNVEFGGTTSNVDIGAGGGFQISLGKNACTFSGFPDTANVGQAITLAERMRIDSDGNLLVGKTTTASATVGIRLAGGLGFGGFTRDDGELLALNRLTTDGNLVEFYQAGVLEGTISVSGTTVSYNGGHLSRWAQMLTKPDLLKGTVMSNLDEMNVYVKPTLYWTEEDELPVDEEGNPTVAVGDLKQETSVSENEQLNKVKVSDVEGDPNVAGVFVNWTYDEAHQVEEINMAMTGDMIIRIAEGVTVARGDLLMSAGDGTAKPQGDDIVRSKTIAKVTSTHVTCTYEDGSYCVPCVLMAC